MFYWFAGPLFHCSALISAFPCSICIPVAWPPAFAQCSAPWIPQRVMGPRCCGLLGKPLSLGCRGHNLGGSAISLASSSWLLPSPPGGWAPRPRFCQALPGQGAFGRLWYVWRRWPSWMYWGHWLCTKIVLALCWSDKIHNLWLWPLGGWLF